MRRIFLFTLFVLLLPSADMVSTDSFVEWEVISPGSGYLRDFVYYPNGNLVAYDEATSFFYNSSLIYDPKNRIGNFWYYRINETDAFYRRNLNDHGTISQAFYNPIKNDTYLVTSGFNVWKYNDTFYINNTVYEIFEGRVMTWYNLTDNLSYRPPSRTGMKMVYDYKNNIIMMYGGSGYFADTWIFDINGKEWMQVMPLNQPGLRAYYGMTYNENDGKIYLHGGRDAQAYYNDLWVYDYPTNTWTKIIVNNQIKTRFEHGMLYDTYNNKLLIYDYSPGKELWAYDFKSKFWTFISSNSGPSTGYDYLNDWIMYGNSSIVSYSNKFYKLHLEMDSSPPGTEIIVTHTETVTTATTSTDYTTVVDKTTKTNYEDITRYQNFTSFLDTTFDETPFYTMGVFSMIVAAIVIRRRRRN